MLKMKFPGGLRITYCRTAAIIFKLNDDTWLWYIPFCLLFKSVPMLISWDLPALNTNFVQSRCFFPLFSPHFSFTASIIFMGIKKKKKNHNHEKKIISRPSNKLFSQRKPINHTITHIYIINIWNSWASKNCHLWFCTQVPTLRV